MKKLFYFLALQLISQTTCPQRFTVANEKQNIFYFGIDNPLSVTVEGYSCNSIFLKINIGTVTGNACRFNYSASHVGTTKIYIFRKACKSLKKVGEANFRVWKIPDPKVKVGPGNGGYIDKNVLGHQQFIRAELENFDFQARFSIESFKVLIIKADNLIFNKTYAGGAIVEELQNTILSLEKDDNVIFQNIKAMGPDGNTLNLDAAVFTIAN